MDQEKASYGMLLERRELVALRLLAARRNQHISEMVRELAIRPLIRQALETFGYKAIPGYTSRWQEEVR